MFVINIKTSEHPLFVVLPSFLPPFFFLRLAWIAMTFREFILFCDDYNLWKNFIIAVLYYWFICVFLSIKLGLLGLTPLILPSLPIFIFRLHFLNRIPNVLCLEMLDYVFNFSKGPQDLTYTLSLLVQFLNPQFGGCVEGIETRKENADENQGVRSKKLFYGSDGMQAWNQFCHNNG